MSEQTISPEVALRIALAARSLPARSVSELIEALQDCLGDTIDETSLSRVTVTDLKTAFGQTYQVDGEEDGEDATTGEIAALKEAVTLLWGETIDYDESLLSIEPDEEGDMPDSRCCYF